MTNAERHAARVDAFRLPENASRLDRATLAFWQAWDGWLRPLLWTMVLMVGAYVLIGQLSGVGGGWSSEVRRLHLLVRWRRGSAEAVSATYSLGNGGALAFQEIFGPPSHTWATMAWAVGVAFVAAMAAALAARRVVRRNAHPERLAVAAALIVTAAHLGLGRLFTLAPLPPGAAGWNLAAVAALWSPPVFAFVAARYPRRTRPG